MNEAASEGPAVVPPKQPPEALALRTAPRPVVRMSRRAIALLIGVAAAALAGAAMWSLSRHLAIGGEGKELYNVDRVQTADGLAKLPPDYRGVARTPDVPQLGGPLPGDLGRPVLRAQEDGRLGAAGAPAAGSQAQAAQARADEARRAHDAIRKADVFFQSARANAPAASAPPTAPAVDAAAGAGQAAAAAPPAEGSQAAKRAFLAAEPDKRVYASAALQEPASPYQLMAGTVIPAALVTGISSDLPGDIIATVTGNVYDSVTGRQLLIPQGARLIGRYDSGVGYAQSRLLLKWERLIFPDGSSILLDNLPGTDTGGRAGLKDRTDNHFDRLIGGAALATVLGVSADLATSNAGGNRDIVISAGGNAASAVGQVGQEITRRNLDVQPTLTIRPGYPLRVLVERDIVLPPRGGR